MSRYGKQVTELLRLARLGDEQSWKTLFFTTYDHLLGVARHYLLDKNESEDVVLETFERAYRYIHSADSQRDGYNWLCKIAQNVCAAHNKKTLLQNSADLNNAAFISEYDVYDRIERNEIKDVLRSLEKQEKQIVYYRFWEDLSYGEIARKLGMKKTTVYDAEKRILSKLSKYFDDPKIH